MEIFKCDVNFKDIWKIVVRNWEYVHTSTFWIFLGLLLSNFRLVLNDVLSSTGYTINAKTPNLSCLLSKLLLCCAHVKEIELELTKIFNLIFCFTLVYIYIYIWIIERIYCNEYTLMLLKFGRPILRQRGHKIIGRNYGLTCRSPPVTEISWIGMSFNE
jgi:hypothetical protein